MVRKSFFFIFTLFSLCLCSATHKYKSNQYKIIGEDIGRFSINVHKVLLNNYNSGENILFSPVGVYYSLALAHLGAGGQTREELAHFLHVPLEEERIYTWHQNFANFVQYFHTVDSSYYNVSVYDQLFVQNGYNVLEQYKNWINQYYHSDIVQVDFSKTDVTNVINQWFNLVTQGRINHFYSEPLSTDVKLLSANVLSFIGQWQYGFPTENTKNDYFHGVDGQVFQVPYMQNLGSYPYYMDVDEHYQAVGIPYQNNEYYMYIVLPNENENLRQFYNYFNYDHIRNIVNQSIPQGVNLKVPVMKLKSVNNHFKNALMDMGITHLFVDADLSNMVKGYQLKVSDIWHYVDMQVNEHGSEMSAGTTHEYKIYEPRKVNDANLQKFYVERPFVFFVYHPETNAVMFYGSVSSFGY